jgi:hypothetical protein
MEETGSSTCMASICLGTRFPMRPKPLISMLRQTKPAKKRIALAIAQYFSARPGRLNWPAREVGAPPANRLLLFRSSEDFSKPRRGSGLLCPSILNHPTNIGLGDFLGFQKIGHVNDPLMSKCKYALLRG